MGRAQKIYFDQANFIDVTFYSSAEAKVFKQGENYIAYSFDGIKGVGKVLKLEKGFLAEFFNKSAVKVNDLESLEKLRAVNFRSLCFTKRRNEVSFFVDIDEVIFEELKTKCTLMDVPGAVKDWGDFYESPLGYVLVNWRRWKEGYAILENIRSMIGVDYELAPYLDEKEADQEQKIDWEEIKNKSHIPIEMLKEFEYRYVEQINYDKIKNYLSISLNLSLEYLDFTANSIEKIEEALWWNWDNLDYYDMKMAKLLLLPCSYYVGNVLIQEQQGLKWRFIPDYNYIDYLWLETSMGKRIDIVSEIAAFLNDPEYMPMLGEAYRTVKRKL